MYEKKTIIIVLSSFIFLSIWILFLVNKDYITINFLFKNIDILRDYIDQNTSVSIIIFILLYIILIIFNFPIATFISLTGGFLFGTFIGFFGIIIGATIGSFIVFIFGKFFFKKFIDRKILVNFPKLSYYFKKNQIELMFLLRLIPGIPLFLQNLILAGLGAKNFNFFFTTLIGIMPWSLVFASLGEGLDDFFYQEQELTIYLIFQLKYFLPILGIIFIILIKLFFKKKLISLF